MSPIQQMLLGVGAVATKTYVDNIFSTFLYTGTGANQIIQNDIAIGSSMAGNSINLSDTSEAERLTRTSALSGVSAGKTFTVSAWVFIPNTGTYGQLFYVDTGSQTRFELGFGNYIQISARNGSNTKFLDVYTASNVPITPGQWNHILVSMDLTNTSNRHVYVNDSSVSMTYDSYGNEDILFNESKVSIFGQDDNNSKLFGHLSNFYFDQTYRNLGTTSNRRLFYAADGTPATGQASLSPIIYYSFDTLSTTNAGSGGDFTFVDSPTLGTFGPYKDTSAANGGMVWIKGRSVGASHIINDTVRGAGNRINSNSSAASSSGTAFLSAFNTNGFSIGNDNDVSYDDQTFSSWTFRKAPGFFDVVKFTAANSSNQRVSHSLGCIPGLILIKNISGSQSWFVYHRDTGEDKYLKLNDTSSTSTVSDCWGPSGPTATDFGFKSSSFFNTTSGEEDEVIAYLFAGGESNASEARSVALDGNDYLSVGSSSDYSMGTGDFTVECWAKSSNTSNKGFFQISSTSGGLQQSNYWQTIAAAYNGSQWACYGNGTFNTIHTSSNETFETDTWYHIAYVRSSGTSKLYVNGVEKISFSDTYDYDGTDIVIGSYYSSGQATTGNISNFRVVKGTALYTAPFTVPDTPLTSTTNTKLLCCNNSSVTGSTVASGTITSTGDPTASTDSPVFDDDAAHIFGESGSESVIKCGSYVGSGSAGLEVNLGWEPQFLIIKRSNATKNWTMFDNMRGIATDGNDAFLYPNLSDAESATGDELDLTPTGFKIKVTGAILNGSGDTYIWMAIRRPDGYVGKPVELGTDVFSLARGAGNPSFPCFVTGFPVDFLLQREFASADSWSTGARLTGTEYMYTNSTDAGAGTNYDWGSNTGAVLDRASSYQGWLWKRHAGMDVICYEGDGVNGRGIAHSMNDVPEMMIVKRRSSTEDWTVYHTGLTSVNYHLTLNSSGAQVDMSSTPVINEPELWSTLNLFVDVFTSKGSNFVCKAD